MTAFCWHKSSPRLVVAEDPGLLPRGTRSRTLRLDVVLLFGANEQMLEKSGLLSVCRTGMASFRNFTHAYL